MTLRPIRSEQTFSELLWREISLRVTQIDELETVQQGASQLNSRKT